MENNYTFVITNNSINKQVFIKHVYLSLHQEKKITFKHKNFKMNFTNEFNGILKKYIYIWSNQNKQHACVAVFVAAVFV